MFPPDIWDPIGAILLPGWGIASFLLFFFTIAYAVLWYTHTTKDIPGAWNPWVIFWLVVMIVIMVLLIFWCIGPLSLGGWEIFTSAPNTCAGDTKSLEGGLCYKECKPGYHGLGVRCYADTMSIGIGTVIGLETCPPGWYTQFLTCSKPITCHSIEDCFKNGNCGCSGGEMIGRLDHGGVCPGPQDFGNGAIRVDAQWDSDYNAYKAAADKPDPIVGPTGMESKESAAAAGHKLCEDIAQVGTDKHTEKIDGMCYKKCPASHPEHVPGMPYLCFKGGDLSYDRGAGTLPHMFRLFGKYPLL